ncbi:dTDP-4-dehydrorhamnose 3,5-epimerase family protein [Streptomyces flavofungini]|uniref:dTDP-4-dehydrorhamnose 3,5-epimerase family protein n=1 Tax=Streptomyces flavofungini TaxID=68200 RepID=UPI0034E04E2D
MRPLSVEGAWEITPRQHADERGVFLTWYCADQFAAETGRPLPLAQANLSVSARGVVRGIHFADVPPGQAKYVTCVRGAVHDVVVDLRVGSPTYGRWDAVRLDEVSRRAVYLPEGTGHGLCALSDEATLCYMSSRGYDPATERGVHPLDPDLAVDWPAGSLLLSTRDREASSLVEAHDAGLLPSYAACRALTRH